MKQNGMIWYGMISDLYMYLERELQSFAFEKNETKMAELASNSYEGRKQI
jgi:hypothetical protein